MLLSKALAAAICLAVSITALRCPAFYSNICGTANRDCDPLNPPNGEWTVIKAQDCLIRMQNTDKIPVEQRPKDKKGRTIKPVPWDARVSTTRWKTTPAQVSSTINNYFNTGGTNVMLWKTLSIDTLKYFGLLRSKGPSGNGQYVDPQKDCTGDSCIATLSKARLTTVGPDENVNRENYERADAFGISGHLALSDFGWVTWTAFLRGVNGALNTAYKASDGLYYGGKDGYVLAERSKKTADGKEVEHDCVVIDLRTLVMYDYI